MKPADPPGRPHATRPWYKKKRFIIPGAVLLVLLLPVFLAGGTRALEADLATAEAELNAWTAELGARTADLEATLASHEELEAQLQRSHDTVEQLEEQLAGKEALEQERDELQGKHDELLARLLAEIGDALEQAIEEEIERSCALAVESGDAGAAGDVHYDADWDYVTDEKTVVRIATSCVEDELARIAAEEAERERQEEDARRRAEEEAEAQRQREEEEAQRQQEQAEPDPPAASRNQGVVHPGAFCSPEGATGVTSAGTAMECKTTPEDSRARWRQR